MVRHLAIDVEIVMHDRTPHEAYMPEWVRGREMGKEIHTAVGHVIRDEQLCHDIDSKRPFLNSTIRAPVWKADVPDGVTRTIATHLYF